MRTAVLFLALSVPAFAGQHHWIDAKLTRIGSDVSENGIVAVPIGNSLAAIPVRQRVTYYRFDTPEINYVFASVNKAPLDVIVNGTTQIAIEGKNGYVREDSGKIKKLRILIKTAKESK